jgi:hypothetical protein
VLVEVILWGWIVLGSMHQDLYIPFLVKRAIELGNIGPLRIANIYQIGYRVPIDRHRIPEDVIVVFDFYLIGRVYLHAIALLPYLRRWLLM